MGDDLKELAHALSVATREEAMARSKGWSVADDWATMRENICARIIKSAASECVRIAAYALVDSRGKMVSVVYDDAIATYNAHEYNLTVVPLYGFHMGPRES